MVTSQHPGARGDIPPIVLYIPSLQELANCLSAFARVGDGDSHWGEFFSSSWWRLGWLVGWLAFFFLGAGNLKDYVLLVDDLLIGILVMILY